MSSDTPHSAEPHRAERRQSESRGERRANPARLVLAIATSIALIAAGGFVGTIESSHASTGRLSVGGDGTLLCWSANPYQTDASGERTASVLLPVRVSGASVTIVSVTARPGTTGDVAATWFSPSTARWAKTISGDAYQPTSLTSRQRVYSSDAMLTTGYWRLVVPFTATSDGTVLRGVTITYRSPGVGTHRATANVSVGFGSPEASTGADCLRPSASDG